MVSDDNDLSADFDEDSKIGFVVESLYTAAHALQGMINDLCTNQVPMSNVSMSSISHPTLLNLLSKVAQVISLCN